MCGRLDYKVTLESCCILIHVPLCSIFVALLIQGHHILIDREDRKSQIRTFKDGIRWLNRGVPLMAFPEGKRSMNGRLMEFKGGLFSMAAKTKCPIVPITISHAHAVMPCNALFPVQAGRGRLHVHVHEPIDAVGRSEEELVELVRRAFLSTLPLEQHPLADEVQIMVGDDQPHQSLDRRETHHSVSLTGSSEVASPPVVQVEISLSKSPLPRTEEGTAEVVELAST
jgi:1-acyl-sn-glycerol-3-phosphate acyltransferase